MTTKEAVEFADMAIQFARSAPHSSSYRIASNVAKLARLGREAHTWAERLCNYGEPKEGANSSKRNSISRRAFAALGDMGLLLPQYKVEVSGDPRGSCLQIECNVGIGPPARFRF